MLAPDAMDHNGVRDLRAGDVTAALFRDFDRAAAARFSFLLSTPAIAAAAAKDAWDLHKSHLPIEKGPLAVGVIVSGLVGMIVIAYFLKYLRRHSLAPFVWYRVIFGIIVIALAAFFRFIALETASSTRAPRRSGSRSSSARMMRRRPRYHQ